MVLLRLHTLSQNAEINYSGFLKTTIVVSFIVLIGKVLGFFRETIIAAVFGATVQTDAFFFAQNMPAMIFPAVCSSISTAFLSIFVIKQEKNGESDADKYASKILNSSILIGILLGLLGMLLAPLLVSVFGPGFKVEGKNLAIHFTRMIMGAFVLNMIQYMFCAILNSRNVFVASQIAGLLYNIVIIFATITFGNKENADILMFSLIAGLIIQDAVLLLFLRRCFTYQFLSVPFDYQFKELLKATIPILIGNCAIQINTIIDQMLASMLPQGSLSSLLYSLTLITFVTNIFVTSLSTVLYPHLSASYAVGNKELFTTMVTKNLFLLTYILIPISVLSIIFSTDIVSIIFGRGNFDENAVSHTSFALICYSPMIVFTGFKEVLNRAYFSCQNSRIPMVNTIFGAIINAFVSILLLKRLRVGGIAIGTTVTAFVTTILLLFQSKRMIGSESIKKIILSFVKLIICGLVMATLICFTRCYIAIDSKILRFILFSTFGFFIYIILTVIIIPVKCKIHIK